MNKKSMPNSNRHVARFIAVISVYNYIALETKVSLKDIVSSNLASYDSQDIFYFSDLKDDDLLKPDHIFLETLINLYTQKTNEFVEIINHSLIDKYKLDKIDKVLQAVICLATVEFLYFADIPTTVIIDEYVSLTKTFYSDSEIGFINKVLDNLSNSIRKEEPVKIEENFSN